ncbi:MAG TPA: hypothetical protein VGJ06_01510 [Candidatus Acidoferrum sp.]
MLVRTGFSPGEHNWLQRETKALGDLSGDQLGLVVAALALADAVQRYRHYDIAGQAIAPRDCRHLLAKVGREWVDPLELQQNYCPD